MCITINAIIIIDINCINCAKNSGGKAVLHKKIYSPRKFTDFFLISYELTAESGFVVSVMFILMVGRKSRDSILSKVSVND